MFMLSFITVASGTAPSGVSTGTTQTTVVPITTTVVCPLTEGMSFDLPYGDIRGYLVNQQWSVGNEFI